MKVLRPKKTARPAPPRDHELAELTLTRSQSRWAAIAGVAAIAAVAVSAYALFNQVQINKQQTILNTYAQERQERKYSSRVAFWAVAGADSSSVRPAGLDVYVQNRSPVPLRNVQISANLTGTGPAAVTLMDLPPCTVAEHRISPPTGGSFIPPDQGRAGYSLLTVQFAVDGRKWKLTSDTLTEVKAWDAAPTTLLRDLLTLAKGTSDCGEAG
jgi:hypothetical protein